MPKAASRAKKSSPRSSSDATIARLKQKVATLQTEVAELKIELEQYIEKWETLDGEAVKALIYLSRHKTGVARAVAKANGVNIQIADLYLRFLAQHHYVRAPASSGKPYTILHKGVRYLEERSLLD
jgi:hypothetical protein